MRAIELMVDRDMYKSDLRYEAMLSVLLELELMKHQRAVQNQELLLNAEVRKYNIGESSLFLVNTREAKLNELRVKIESLRTKYEKALATLLFAAGLADWQQ